MNEHDTETWIRAAEEMDRWAMVASLMGESDEAWRVAAARCRKRAAEMRAQAEDEGE